MAVDTSDWATCAIVPTPELPCKPGTGGRFKCSVCPTGTWAQGGVAESNDASRLVPRCNPCPTGLVTLVEGATSPQQCTVCAPGYGSSGDSSKCEMCSVGSHSVTPNSSFPKPPCALCPYNFITGSAGTQNSSGCSVCAPGYGGKDCGICGRRMYSPGGNSFVAKPECVPCPPGTSTPYAGAVSAIECTPEVRGRAVCMGPSSAATAALPGIGDIVSVSVGVNHACAVQANGTLVCFGQNDSGQLNIPADLGAVASVSAGYWHTCVLLRSGSVRCFGDNGEQQCAVPVGLKQVVAVGAGQINTCALLADGATVCWGFSLSKVVPSFIGRLISTVTTGGVLKCAIDTSRMARCWGQLEVPLPADLGPVLQIAGPPDYFTSSSGACAVTIQHTVRCLGGPGFRRGLRDVGFDGLQDVKAISFSNLHACAVLHSGALRCFNTNGEPQGQQSVRAELGSQGAVAAISSGLYHTCTIVPPPATPEPCAPGSGGRYRCAVCSAGTWSPGGSEGAPLQPCRRCAFGFTTLATGATSSAQCTVCAPGYGGPACLVCRIGTYSQGGSEKRERPNCGACPPGTSTPYAGASHRADCTPPSASGRLICLDRMAERQEPLKDTDVISVSMGYPHSCAVTSNRSVVCFDHEFQQVEGFAPADLGPVSSVSVGNHHACAVTATGGARCFGRNDHNQCGVPPGLKNVVTVSAGTNNTCAVLANGAAVCWGSNAEGESSVPPSLAGSVTAVVAGHTTCATTVNQTGGVWGRFDPEFSAMPSIEDLGPVAQFGSPSEGGYGCVLRVGGIVKCWGMPFKYAGAGGSYGLDGLRDVRSISLGSEHACAILRNGAARCFGTIFTNWKTLPDGVDAPGAAIAVAAGYNSQTCVIKRHTATGTLRVPSPPRD